MTNLGTLWLTPKDTDTNGMADDWEKKYFGINPPSPREDSDEDGHNNDKEYKLETEPTNRNSVMKLQIASQEMNRLTFTWPVANGRLYNILTSGQLTSDLWQPVFGPCEATYDQTQMQCTITNAADQTKGFYRIRVPMP